MRSTYSLSAITSSAAGTIRRFPFETAVALIGTLMALVLVNGHDLPFVTSNARPLMNIVVCSPLLMTTMLSISIAREHGRMLPWIVWSLRLLAVALSIVVIGTLRTSSVFPIEVATLALATHAFVAMAPFSRGAIVTWSFNRALFVRICLAAVFTGVLTGGLVTALGALKVLFDVDVKPEYYGSVVTLVLGVFNTLFVLAGIPESDEIRLDLPRSLRWFVQFVLITLVAVFAVILYAYGVKVVFFSDLRGAVANYILWMGVVSLLAWVLAWPLRDDPEHRVVGFYVRWLGVFMVPMAVLLVVAISTRIAHYGVTPPRFAVATLTAFFVLTVIYLTVWRKPDLRMIPLALCIMGCITAIGPLGSAEVTIRNQASRASTLLESHGMGRGEAIDTTRFALLPVDTRRQWLTAFRSIADVDTTVARKYAESLGLTLQDDVKLPYGFSIKGISTADLEEVNALRYRSIDYPSEASDGLIMDSPSVVYAGSVRSGRTSDFGPWKLVAGDGGTRIVIMDTTGVRVDTIDLGFLDDRVRDDEELSLADRTATSQSGRFRFILMTGTLSIMPRSTVSVDLDGILQVRQ